MLRAACHVRVHAGLELTTTITGCHDMDNAAWPRSTECQRSEVYDMQFIRQCSLLHLTCGRCLQKPCCPRAGLPGRSS